MFRVVIWSLASHSKKKKFPNKQRQQQQQHDITGQQHWETIFGQHIRIDVWLGCCFFIFLFFLTFVVVVGILSKLLDLPLECCLLFGYLLQLQHLSYVCTYVCMHLRPHAVVVIFGFFLHTKLRLSGEGLLLLRLLRYRLELFFFSFFKRKTIRDHKAT